MRSRIVAAACAVVLGAGSMAACAGEYFLDAGQRRDLLLYGRLTGHDQALYDIWIVPGYVPPGRHVRSGWAHAGEALGHYGDPDYYHDTLDITRKAMRYARRDIVGEFALRGSGEAWTGAVANAQRRVERRVFGWQLAWPWALLSATTGTVVRTGIGVPGGVGAWAGSALVVPAVALVAPAGIGAGYALGEGVAVPLAGVGWNTLVAPPLALVGEQPAAERADGWWMKRLADPARADMQARLADWQRGWPGSEELTALRDDMVQAQAAHAAQVAELEKALAVEQGRWREIRERQSAQYADLALREAMARLPALRADLAAQGYTPARLEAERAALEQALVDGGLPVAVARRVVSALAGAPAGPAREADDKIDVLGTTAGAPPLR